MSALSEVKLIVRGIAVWFAWFLLTAEPTHGNSYGDLRRLTPKQFAAHLAPLALVVGVGAHLATSVPSGFGAVWAVGTVVWIAGAVGLVATTMVMSRLIDIHLTYA
jgi:hypothetical protein